MAEKENFELIAEKLLQRMIGIYSPSGAEQEMVQFIREKMVELGYSTDIDEVGNVIGHIGKGGSKILLCGHLDTITPNLPSYMEDGVLYGRGSVDAKSSLASMIIAGRLAHIKGYKGEIIVVGVLNEEGDNRGVKALINSGMKVDYAVFGEPTNTNAISIGYKGCVVVQVAIRNASGHSSAPWVYPNAIEKSMDFYNFIKKSIRKLNNIQTGFNAITVCVREINGGANMGVIPGECQMIIEIRLPHNIHVKFVEEWLNERVKDYENKYPKERLEYKILDSVNPYLTNKKNILVKAFSRTIYKIQRSRVPLVKKTGTSDMNYYGEAFGVPCITYGPGDSRLSHTDKESVTVHDYLKSIEILTNAILLIEDLQGKN